ncbi:MAG: ABC transporter substrate-binding protein, partial [bacterium]
DYDWENTWCPLWAQWYVTGGKAGEEPPKELKDLLKLWEKMQTTLSDKERIKLGQEILKSNEENLWTIGTVGLAPQPIIAKNNLRNIPEKGLWGYDHLRTYPYFPAQFFFKK